MTFFATNGTGCASLLNMSDAIFTSKHTDLGLRNLRTYLFVLALGPLVVTMILLFIH